MDDSDAKLIYSDDTDIGTFNLCFKCSACDMLYLYRDDAFRCCNADVKFKQRPETNDSQLGILYG